MQGDLLVCWSIRIWIPSSAMLLWPLNKPCHVMSVFPLLPPECLPATAPHLLHSFTPVKIDCACVTYQESMRVSNYAVYLPFLPQLLQSDQ